jgi:hypothetical protein
MVPPLHALPAALVEELGRILGESLVLHFQQDSGVIDKTPSGFDYPEDDTHE